jgi:drug/metabolite transporter (DMT)-like permease
VTSTRAFGLGLLATVGAVVIWGLQVPIGKRVLAEADGITLAVLRYSVATLGFCGLLVLREGVAALSPSGHSRVLWVSGGIGIGGSVMLFFVGLTLTRPESAAIIGALQPGLAVLAQWLIYRRRPARFTLACIVVAFLGVVLVVSRGGQIFSGASPLSLQEMIGNLLVFIGSLAWVTYSIAIAPISHWSSARISALTCAFGIAVSIPVWLISNGLGLTRFPANPDTRMIAELAFLAIGGALVAIFLWNTGLRRIGVVNAVLLGSLSPVVAFIALAIMGAEFQRSELLGVGLVVSALIANNLNERRLLTQNASR